MTGDRTHGLTAADLGRQLRELGDDNPAERLDYDLGHALEGWHDATQRGANDTAGQLQWATSNSSTTVPLSREQHDRLTRILNVDAGLHLAHAAATRQD